MTLEENSILYQNIRRVYFPEGAGFMGQKEMRAFALWATTNPPEFPNIIKFMSSQFRPLLVHLSHALNTIEYAVSAEFEKKHIFPSIEVYLVCVLFHFIPAQYYGDIDFDDESIHKINAALALWQSGLIPIFDGLTWRLHNSSSVVSTGINQGGDLKLDG